MDRLESIQREFTSHENGIEYIDIDGIVAATVARQPLNKTPLGEYNVASQSHLMWLSRETQKLMARNTELATRENLVSTREEAIRALGISTKHTEAVHTRKAHVNIDGIITSIIKNRPLNEKPHDGYGTACQSHLMWLSRETQALMARNIEVARREKRVSLHEEAVRTPANAP